MFKYYIDRMSEKILEEANVDVKSILEEYWKNKIALIWGTDDVIYYGEQHGIKITEEKAREILWKIQSNHDAEIGVNWDVIDYYVHEEVE